MTKTTKVIAALGVVAGLGVAALPLSSYAAEVNGNVRLEVTIDPSLAMRIHSNSDADTYAEVTPAGTENPSQEGWYESDGSDGYELSEDATVQPGTTYYEKTGNYYGAIDHDPTDATEADIAGPSMAKLLSIAQNGVDLTTLQSSIDVRSNNGTYQVVVNDADANTGLQRITANDPETLSTTDVIPAMSTDAPAAGVKAWAFKSNGTGSAATNWTAMVANDVTGVKVAEQTGAYDGADYDTPFTVNYGVGVGNAATGTYTDTITYTATNVNS